jgi:uncharacterized Zn finger protein
VIDLEIEPHGVSAIVGGASVYSVKITISEVPKAQWKSICADCAGGIDSLVELLQGRFSKGVMERICRQGIGLFPKPAEIRFSCSCPDGASMCKHVAAALYGVGARLDARPELLFRLRGVDENDLVGDIGEVLPMSKQGPAAGKVLEADDMAALFGLDMGDGRGPVEGVAGTPSVAKLMSATKEDQPEPRLVKKAEPAKKIARARVVPSGQAGPKPVEWWKPGPLKQAGPARKGETTRPAPARKVRAAS